MRRKKVTFESRFKRFLDRHKQLIKTELELLGERARINKELADVRRAKRGQELWLMRSDDED